MITVKARWYHFFILTILMNIIFLSEAQAQTQSRSKAAKTSLQNAPIPIPQKTKQKVLVRVPKKKLFVGPPAPPPVEIVQQDLSERVVSLANQLDSFFGLKRADDEKNGSTLRIIPSHQMREYATPVSEFEIRLNLKLLNLEKQGRALEDRIFSRDKKEEEEQLDVKPATKADRAYEAEQKRQRELQEQWGWNYNFENRIIVKNPLGLLSKIRVRKNFEGDIFTHRFFNEFGWHSDTLWQENANFSSDYPLSDTLLYRFSNELNWIFRTNIITSSHGPSLIKSLSAQDSISYDARINGVIQSFNWTLDNYGLGVTYRRQLDNKWIFYDLNPSLYFSRAENFKRAFAFFIRFEFVFGDN